MLENKNNEVVEMDQSINNVDPFRTMNMSTYVREIMPDEMKDFQAAGRIKSGFANLDAKTNLYPGLYFLGGQSSLGKTTLAHQMSDQIAQSGEHVLYFSLEQSALELSTKSLGRNMYLLDPDKALTSLQIRKTEASDPRLGPTLQKYLQYAGNITVVECSFKATIDDIEKYVNEYIQRNKIKPVVVIDYLQVIQAPEDSRKSTKDLVDGHVYRLKRLQSDNRLIMIVISSLNRQNYLTEIAYESFKESGGIEYTADVVWGLQLQVIHDELFDGQGKTNEKREKIREAKKATPRKVELVCLKNRFGASSYSCDFDYYPAYDYFKADMTGVNVVEYKDLDGEATSNLDEKCPFVGQQERIHL